MDSSNKAISEIKLAPATNSQVGSSLIKQQNQLNQLECNQSKFPSVESYKQGPMPPPEDNHQVQAAEQEPQTIPEESLESKLDKIKGIFNSQDDFFGSSCRADKPNGEFIESTPQKPNHAEDEDENLTSQRIRLEQVDESRTEVQQTPLNKEVRMPKIKHEQRPITQKQKEIMELAQLIQEATGSVNNVVESFQNFKPLTNRNKGQQQPKESVQLSRPSNLGVIQQKIQEDSCNDNQIISNLDMMIMNLEKQQQDNERIQSKFSSNVGFVSQRKDPEVSN